MPKIFEILGYPVTDNSPSVTESRKRAYCPFISDQCDGGGNRYMSEILLKNNPELRKFFHNLETVPSGVCSIQINENESPWIICPRRLLYMGKHADENILRGSTQSILLEKCKFKSGTSIGIWSELKVKYNSESEDGAFDYTFDYVLTEIGRKSLLHASQETKISTNELEKLMIRSGFTLSQRNNEIYIENFPVGYPIIVEVMTSSTSGGNKTKRSCIPQAFEDCILGKEHLAPGINYRQVWARMASQLIVKSQAALEWGGRTIWVLQDLLANYISSTTALDLKKFISEHIDEVNILSFSYSSDYNTINNGTPIQLHDATLFSGPIRSSDDFERPCFQDIVLASVCPPKDVLLNALCRKGMANQLIV